LPGHVGGDGDKHRAGPPAGRQPQRAADQLGQTVLGARHEAGLGDRAVETQQVELLECLPPGVPDEDVIEKDEHGRRRIAGRRDAVGRVRRTRRPARDHHRGDTGQAGIGLRHESGARLMPDAEETEPGMAVDSLLQPQESTRHHVGPSYPGGGQGIRHQIAQILHSLLLLAEEIRRTPILPGSFLRPFLTALKQLLPRFSHLTGN
jgi:hypothetical protein